MRTNFFIQAIRHARTILLALLSASSGCYAQANRSAAESRVDRGSADRDGRGGSLDSIPKLQEQVRALEIALEELRGQTASYRAEMLEIRRELQLARTQRASLSAPSAQPPTTYADFQSPQISSSNGVRSGAPGGGPAIPPQARTDEEQRVAKLEEDYQLLSGKVDDQYQTKVESASKYRARLFGIMLLNVFANRGSVDNLDFPMSVTARAALDSSGTFGATLRQTQLGLEVFGPVVGGAKTSAALQLDFAGGFANTINGVNYGIVRLRTGTMRLDWARTSLVAGQDSLFFAPLSPTSLATIASPALSWAGNIWAWVPQVRVEHHVALSERSSFTLQGGMLSPQSGELGGTGFQRSAQAGEKSRQPASAARIAWSYGPSERSIVVGVGGYYERQNWGLQRTIDGWAGTADASIPLGRLLTFTGAFYRGRAIGGLEAATGRSIVTRGALADPRSNIKGLNAAGGWLQLKFEPTSKWEFNAAGGQDNPFARDIRMFPDTAGRFASLARNRSAFVNFIYRPRSDILFSTEYRRMRTWDIRTGSRTADHINLAMGILF